MLVTSPPSPAGDLEYNQLRARFLTVSNIELVASGDVEAGLENLSSLLFSDPVDNVEIVPYDTPIQVCSNLLPGQAKRDPEKVVSQYTIQT